MLQLGWFSTGRDRAARDLLTAANSAIKRGEIEAEIAFVFCNREPGESEESDLFIKLVEDYHIPLICFSYQKYRKSLARKKRLILSGEAFTWGEERALLLRDRDEKEFAKFLRELQEFLRGIISELS